MTINLLPATYIITGHFSQTKFDLTLYDWRAYAVKDNHLVHPFHSHQFPSYCTTPNRASPVNQSNSTPHHAFILDGLNGLSSSHASKTSVVCFS